MKIVEKIITTIIIIAGFSLFVKGIIEAWILHIILGIIGISTGIIFLFSLLAKTAPFYDEKNNRLYRFVSETENPFKGKCPLCDNYCSLIITITNKHHYGIYCPYHGEVWFDLQKRKAEK
ncbi:MAG TPA: hypothetical protein ENI52_01240 [Thermoplasmata archaeon]|nr:hypothetical protein [Thermoplasmata archaeon]